MMRPKGTALGRQGICPLQIRAFGSACHLKVIDPKTKKPKIVSGYVASTFEQLDNVEVSKADRAKGVRPSFNPSDPNKGPNVIEKEYGFDYSRPPLATKNNPDPQAPTAIYRAMQKPCPSGLFAIIFLALTLALSSAHAIERVALIIANNDYPADSQFPDLKNCVNDAELISKTLSAFGFGVIVVKAATLSAMDEALSNFDGKIEGVYPWATAWPPPIGAGNFSGEEPTLGEMILLLAQ